MINSPEVSIVITLFREGDLLRDSVESALGQSFGDTEVVLVDNNADPVTRGIAEEFSARFPRSVRVVHESVQGASSARNRGILESRGRFVAFLDGDDIADSQRIELQRKCFLKTPGLSLVSGRYDRVSLDNRTIVRKDVSETEPKIWLETQNLLKNLYPIGLESGRGKTLHFPLTSTTFFERSTALSAGGFETRLNPRWFEDIEFYLRMYGKGEFAKVPVSLVRYRISSSEMMEVKRQQMDWMGFCRHMDLFYHILWEIFGDSPKAPEVLRKLSGLWLTYLGTNFLGYRQGRSLGKKMLKRSLVADPRSLETWKLWIKAQLPQEFYPRLFWFEKLAEESLSEEFPEDLGDSIFLYQELKESVVGSKTQGRVV